MNKQLIQSEALRFLKQNATAVLATSFLNLPHASTIYYVSDSKFNVYFLTKENTDKHLNLKSNKNVALVIGMGPKHISIQIRGHATILKDKKQSEPIIREIESSLEKSKIKGKEIPIRKIAAMQAKDESRNGEILYKVSPAHLSFLNLDDSAFPNSISDRIHSIIPSSGKSNEKPAQTAQ